MTGRKPINEPLDAAAEADEVITSGPEGIAFSLTPEAAERSAEALADQARRARARREGGAAGDGTPPPDESGNPATPD